jgi:hypothetical protein
VNEIAAPLFAVPEAASKRARLSRATATLLVEPEETTANGAMIAGHFFIAKPASLVALTRCIEDFTRE